MITAYKLQSEIGKRIYAITDKYAALISQIDTANFDEKTRNGIYMALIAKRDKALEALVNASSIIDETLSELEKNAG